MAVFFSTWYCYCYVQKIILAFKDSLCIKAVWMDMYMNQAIAMLLLIQPKYVTIFPHFRAL